MKPEEACADCRRLFFFFFFNIIGNPKEKPTRQRTRDKGQGKRQRNKEQTVFAALTNAVRREPSQNEANNP